MSYVPPSGAAIQVTLAGAYTPPAGNAIAVTLNPPESGYIFASTASVSTSIECLYIAPVLADMPLQTLGAASQIEGFHAPAVDADITAVTEDSASYIDLFHIQFASADFEAVTEDVVADLDLAFSAYHFAAADATTAGAVTAIQAEHKFDLMHGVTSAGLPTIVGTVDLVLPLYGAVTVPRPAIDSAVEATYQSYLQGITLPVPVASGTVNYEMTLQGVT